MESEALVLISKLEEKRLEDLKCLEANVRRYVSHQSCQSLDVKGLVGSHAQGYVSLGSTNSAQLALQAAPFLADVPQSALQGLVEDVAQVSGWELLKGLMHVNRRRRRALLNAPEWIVHLYAGAPGPKPFSHLESKNVAVLELDINITRGSDQDVLRTPSWRVLVWVLSKAKCRIFLVLRCAVHLTRMLMVMALSHLYEGHWTYMAFQICQLHKGRRLIVSETALLCRQIWFHAVATAGRKVRPPAGVTRLEVGFLLEHPMPVDRYVPPSHALFGQVPSFWNTGLWNSYADEAGLFEVHVYKGDLEHAISRPTTLGTNYGDLQYLETLSLAKGLRGVTVQAADAEPESESSCAPHLHRKSHDSARWAPGFAQAASMSIQNWSRWFRIAKTKADEQAWRDHVKNNHQPFRKDGSVCIRTAASGRRHVGVTHPSQFTLPADVCGPLKVPGVDPEGRSKAPKKFKYFLAASYGFPRLHGMPENPDPLGEGDLSKEEPLDDFLEGAGVGLTEEEARDILENLSEDDGPPLLPPPHESQDVEEEEDGEEAQEEEADDEEEALPNRSPQEGD